MNRSNRRVLVVDEDPETRLAVDRQLDTLGWDALTVNTGREAIRVVEMGMVVDVMLAELRLPDLDGVTAAMAVSRMLPRVRLAFMAWTAPEPALEARNAPLLLKPFSTTALANALAGAMPYPRIGYPR